MAPPIATTPYSGKVYDESHRLASGDFSRWAVDVHYAHAALQDTNETLSVEEARGAYQALQACIKPNFLFAQYDPGCLEGKIIQDFRGKDPRFKELQAKNGDQLFQNLAAMRDPYLIAKMWVTTAPTPLMQHLVFYHPDARGWLSLLGAYSDWDARGFNVAVMPTMQPSMEDIHRTEKNITVFYMENFPSDTTPEKWVEIFSPIFYEFQLRSQEIFDYSNANRNLQALVKAGNPFALSKAIEQAVENQNNCELLFDIVLNSPHDQLVRRALVALATFDDPRAKDFLLNEFKNGSFNAQFFLETLLPTAASMKDKRFGKIEPQNQFEMLMGVMEISETKLDIGRVTYTTTFFRFPKQFEWVTEEIKKLARQKSPDEKIKIVSVGGSYGPEAYSLLFYLDNDFQKNPRSWGNIHPFERIEIFSTDISDIALKYAQRGQFIERPAHSYSDIHDFEDWQRFGINPADYFDIDYSHGIYRVKKEFKDRIRFEYLDVLNPQKFVERFGKPDGVLFNMVDGHLGSEEKEAQAAHELSKFVLHFIATIPRKQTAPKVFKEEMVLGRELANAYIFYPKTLP